MGNFFKKYYFLIYLSSFVVFCSFFIGISIGLKRAKAKEQSLSFTHYANNEVIFEKIRLPDDVELAPIGKNIEINGKSAEIANFVTNRNVDELIFKQMGIWKKEGLEVVGGASSKRGFAIAIGKEKKERYSIRAWKVPEILRKTSVKEKSVQGIFSYVSMDGYDKQGLVPGVPVMPEGKAGTLFSAEEPHLGRYFGRSYVGVYTNPGSVEDGVSFYREYFQNSSWNSEEMNLPLSSDASIANLVFTKEREEITLLFSALSRDKTVVNVVRVNK